MWSDLEIMRLHVEAEFIHDAARPEKHPKNLTRVAMTKAFAPSFRHFQKDIEARLTSEGKREMNEHGQTVYRGYHEAVPWMFRAYIENAAFAPLVAEFRTWNWEWGYNEYLLELTDCLRRATEWSLLETLWAAVVAKRRTNYTRTRKAQKAVPETIPAELVTKTRDLLLESLYRIRGYASELQQESDEQKYTAMIAKLENERIP